MSSSFRRPRALLRALFPDHQVRTRLEQAGFTGPELELLTRHGRLVRFSAGDPVTKVGGHERRLLLLLEGTVDARRLDGDGARLEASYAEPEIIGEISMFGTRHYNVADVTAVTAVVAVGFPMAARSVLEAGAPRLMGIVAVRSAPRVESLTAATLAHRAEVQRRLALYQQTLARVQG